MEEIATMQEQASMIQQAFYFEEVHYSNNNEGYFFQPHNNMPSYYNSGWRTYENFSYGNPSFQSQEGSSSNYQGQIRQLSFEEQILALLDETKKENDTQEKRFPNMEANFTNHASDMCATIDRLVIQVGQLTMAIKEKSSRQLLSDIEDDSI